MCLLLWFEVMIDRFESSLLCHSCYLCGSVPRASHFTGVCARVTSEIAVLE